ncbi:hypothetical protein [Streptomyces sp. NBC_01264]|uniref:hypothetical protein n=1 Tax=Streptomyces sp. NBC_01264 TaxID=2903804 RepID=UPI002255A691|nr:hypothetical protein [Streptomyces sp. NBC_01264]MCX4782987.1 hypothetical protein [Streptomyces sp. NBC_01264]
MPSVVRRSRRSHDVPWGDAEFGQAVRERTPVDHADGAVRGAGRLRAEARVDQQRAAAVLHQQAVDARHEVARGVQVLRVAPEHQVIAERQLCGLADGPAPRIAEHVRERAALRTRLLGLLAVDSPVSGLAPEEQDLLRGLLERAVTSR